MISHTDELPTDYMKRSYPPLLMFDPLSMNKVMDLIAKIKNSAAGNDEIRGVLQLLTTVLIKTARVYCKNDIKPSSSKHVHNKWMQSCLLFDILGNVLICSLAERYMRQFLPLSYKCPINIRLQLTAGSANLAERSPSKMTKAHQKIYWLWMVSGFSLYLVLMLSYANQLLALVSNFVCRLLLLSARKPICVFPQIPQCTTWDSHVCFFIIIKAVKVLNKYYDT